VAYTLTVESFDGTEISTNFFPAVSNSLLPGNYGATLFNGPGLGSPGTTDPYGSNQAAGSTPGLAILRGALQAQSGFNVITWDPRGEFDSGGVLQLDNPFYEGRDVSALIDWSLANTPTIQVQDSPLIGMIGGSYGGGIQMATVDPRIKSIVPAIAWHSLNESLYPDNVFKAGWANTFFLSLLETGARINDQIPRAVFTGNLFGFISETAQAVLSSSGPTSLLTKLSIPTMYVQGIVDALFPLAQAVENAQTQLEENPYFSGANANQVKMTWFCGGHGVCFDFTAQQQTAQATTIFTQDMAWLNTYVKGAPLPIDQIVPTFQWWDQKANHYASALMPFANGFVTGTVVGSNADGGRLAVLPLAIGGSGPNRTTGCSVANSCSWPFNQVFATPARNSIDVAIAQAATGTQIVGTPKVSFTYSGVGTAKAVYGQLIDNQSGRVLGNIVTPIPVTLDGKTRTVELAELADIAYTAAAGGTGLTLQIVGGATLFKTGKFGSINISDVEVQLPTTTSGTIV
jgi:ABC-2 type transport system ATP-binding protein